MFKACELIGFFLSTWGIRLNKGSFQEPSDKKMLIIILSQPDEIIKQIIESGPSFGLTIALVDNEPAQEGITLSFTWEDLKEVKDLMTSVAMIENKTSNSSESEKKSGSWIEKVAQIYAKENELGIPQGID